MAKPAVPKPSATSRRKTRGVRTKSAKAAAKEVRGFSTEVICGSRGSCFHMAMQFNTMVESATPWMIWIRCTWVKSRRRTPNRLPHCPPCR